MIRRLIDVRLKWWSKLPNVEFIESQFLVIAKKVREWARCFCLEKLWSASHLVYQNQEQWNFCKHHMLDYDT
uniref:Uncharacterized protein n=1 Tax=Triticum urartu TaxID=4572 RepID=A0A8R7QNY0_TRIUA